MLRPQILHAPTGPTSHSPGLLLPQPGMPGPEHKHSTWARPSDPATDPRAARQGTNTHLFPPLQSGDHDLPGRMVIQWALNHWQLLLFTTPFCLLSLHPGCSSLNSGPCYYYLDNSASSRLPNPLCIPSSKSVSGRNLPKDPPVCPFLFPHPSMALLPIGSSAVR